MENIMKSKENFTIKPLFDSAEQKEIREQRQVLQKQVETEVDAILNKS